MASKKVTKKEALKIKCSVCGGSPKFFDDYLYSDGLCGIYCDNCGRETLVSYRLHDVTGWWAHMNKVGNGQ